MYFHHTIERSSAIVHTENAPIAQGEVKRIDFRGRPIEVNGEGVMTAHQLRFISLAALGMTVSEIAEISDRSPDTIKTSMKQGYRRLRAPNICAATRKLFEMEVFTPESQADIPSKLSTREIQLIDLLSHGLRREDVAQVAGISPLTVKEHASRIARRLDMKQAGTAGLVMLGFCDGFLPLTQTAQLVWPRQEADDDVLSWAV